MTKTQFCGYRCDIMTTYQQILIILDNFEIIFIGALFPPGTAVPTSGLSSSRSLSVNQLVLGHCENCNEQIFLRIKFYDETDLGMRIFL